jgi:hypothetical protein
MLLKAAYNKRASSFLSKMLNPSAKRAFGSADIQAFAET